MMCGIIVGTAIKAGQLPPQPRAVNIAGKAVAYPTNSIAPEWERDRSNYSKMLCAAVDIYVSPGGVSS